MKPQSCPLCHTPSLLPTGAYWTCQSCRLAITTHALVRERGKENQRSITPMSKRPRVAHLAMTNLRHDHDRFPDL